MYIFITFPVPCNKVVGTSVHTAPVKERLPRTARARKVVINRNILLNKWYFYVNYVNFEITIALRVLTHFNQKVTATRIYAAQVQ